MIPRRICAMQGADSGFGKAHGQKNETPPKNLGKMQGDL